MKLIHFRAQSLNNEYAQLIDNANFNITCIEGNDCYCSDEDAEQLKNVIPHEEYSIEDMTMEKLAELMNSSNNGWNIVYFDIIEKSGWVDDTSTQYGICHSNNETLVFDERGKAKIINK